MESGRSLFQFLGGERRLFSLPGPWPQPSAAFAWASYSSLFSVKLGSTRRKVFVEINAASVSPFRSLIIHSRGRAREKGKGSVWGCIDLTDSGLRVKTRGSPHENTDKKPGVAKEPATPSNINTKRWSYGAPAAAVRPPLPASWGCRALLYRGREKGKGSVLSKFNYEICHRFPT